MAITWLTLRKLATALLCVSAWTAFPAIAQGLPCWFVPGSEGPRCKLITDALSRGSGVAITPRVAQSYTEIFKAFAEKKDALVYAGSFTSALLTARRLAVPLAQRVDSQEFYSGVMIFPRGGNPTTLLKEHGAEVAFAIGASSGESSAKAATGGKAALGVKDHMAAANAIKAGKARAAFVKNWWWQANSSKFPELQMFEVPGVSEQKNPDNILLVSVSVTDDLRARLLKAAMASKDAFGATRMDRFDAKELEFSQGLMAKGGINLNTYVF
jgi:ABC-type phosphate/phosphonate transport system substrate-binding protein